MDRMKYWETIADNLSKAGWSWGCVSSTRERDYFDFVASLSVDSFRTLFAKITAVQSFVFF